MVPPGENFCPGWPHDQLLVVDHLVGLVGAGDQLGGVAAEEHQHDGGEKGGHGGVAPVMCRDGVVQAGCSLILTEHKCIECLIK